MSFSEFGTYREKSFKVKDSSVGSFQPFVEPTDALGSTLDMNIATLGQRDLQFRASFGKKFSRELMASGDSLIVWIMNTPTGCCLLTDLVDGFTPISKAKWDDFRKLDRKAYIPPEPDLFASELNDRFTKSDEIQRWFKNTVDIVGQLKNSVDSNVHIQNHESPITETALKEIVRSYLESKNNFRTNLLGADFFRAGLGKEIANGIFGVSSMFIPLEALNISEVKGTKLSGSSVGGFALCRSLADIGISTTFPGQKVFLVDSNAFFDKFVSRLETTLDPEQFSNVKAYIYEKVNEIYAAFNQQGVNFALTEEESLSGVVYSDSLLSLSGATDGGYYSTRTHSGDPLTLFLAAIDSVGEDPKILKARMAVAKDDYLVYNMTLK